MKKYLVSDLNKAGVVKIEHRTHPAPNVLCEAPDWFHDEMVNYIRFEENPEGPWPLKPVIDERRKEIYLGAKEYRREKEKKSIQKSWNEMTPFERIKSRFIGGTNTK